MKFENTEVYNIKAALRGMRNPKESWAKNDTYECSYQVFSRYPSKEELFPKRITGTIGNDLRLVEIGSNDLKLAQKLILAGNEHSKFMRQIFVSVDITAPLYWFKEFDTYKVGTVANSTSSMHRLTSTPITLNCFEIGDLDMTLKVSSTYSRFSLNVEDRENLEIRYGIEYIIEMLENLRLKFLETKDKRYWKELIRLLPESWLQTRTVTMSYANVRNMVQQRDYHKLTEWSVDFINLAKSLPYADELIFIGGDK